MFLIRKPDDSTASCYPLDGKEAHLSAKSCTKKRVPHAWSWSSRLGSGFSAIGNTQEEAEMLLREAMRNSWRENASVVA